MKRTLLPVLFLALICYGAMAQSPHSDMIYSSPLFYNPAFAGHSGGTSLVTQFRALPFAPPRELRQSRQANFAFDHYLEKPALGIGIYGIHNMYDRSFLYSYLGEVNTIGGSVSKRIVSTGSLNVTAGAGFSYFKNIIYYTRPRYGWVTIIVDRFPVENYRYDIANFQLGLLIEQKKLLIGLEADYSGTEDKYWEDQLGYNFQMVYQERWKEDKWGYALDFNVFGRGYYGYFSLGNTLRYRWAAVGARMSMDYYTEDPILTFYAGYRAERWSVNLSQERDVFWSDYYLYPTGVSIGWQVSKNGEQYKPYLPF